LRALIGQARVIQQILGHLGLPPNWKLPGQGVASREGCGRGSFLEPLDHRVREVECHAVETRMNQPDERQQATVAAPEIKNTGYSRREEFEQHRLTFR
jgi:hypothetical protein